MLTKESEYQEYIQISKALKEEAKNLYGESQRESKDAEKNALFDLKKRTGNAILTELKRQDSQIKPLPSEEFALGTQFRFPIETVSEVAQRKNAIYHAQQLSQKEHV